MATGILSQRLSKIVVPMEFAKGDSAGDVAFLSREDESVDTRFVRMVTEKELARAVAADDGVVEELKVHSQTPAAGTLAAVGSRVDIVLTLGRNITGKDLVLAHEAFRDSSMEQISQEYFKDSQTQEIVERYIKGDTLTAAQEEYVVSQLAAREIVVDESQEKQNFESVMQALAGAKIYGEPTMEKLLR